MKMIHCSRKQLHSLHNRVNVVTPGRNRYIEEEAAEDFRIDSKVHCEGAHPLCDAFRHRGLTKLAFFIIICTF